MEDSVAQECSNTDKKFSVISIDVCCDETYNYAVRRLKLADATRYDFMHQNFLVDQVLDKIISDEECKNIAIFAQQNIDESVSKICQAEVNENKMLKVNFSKTLEGYQIRFPRFYMEVFAKIHNTTITPEVCTLEDNLLIVVSTYSGCGREDTNRLFKEVDRARSILKAKSMSNVDCHYCNNALVDSSEDTNVICRIDVGDIAVDTSTMAKSCMWFQFDDHFPKS